MNVAFAADVAAARRRLEEALSAQLIATRQALTTTHAKPGRSEGDGAPFYEVELRLGMCVVDAQRREARQLRVGEFGRVPYTFEAHVDEMRWRATFAALAARDDVRAVGARERTTHERHGGELRRELSADGAAESWCEKTTLWPFVTDVALAARRPWCDVRIALARERRNCEPPLGYDAAAADKRPLQRSVDAHGHVSAVPCAPPPARVRERRTLVFAWAPRWRVDFTIVDALDIARGIQHRSFELELEHELVGGDKNGGEFDVAAAAGVGLRVLDAVLTACGRRDRDFERLVAARTHARELESLS